MMTLVVPSPTSSSCVLLNSIILFAAGCATSISLKIEFPSLVRTIPPIGSRIILSIAFGPRQVRMTSETVLEAWMLAVWALRPEVRSGPVSGGMKRRREGRGNAKGIKVVGERVGGRAGQRQSAFVEG